MTKENLSYSIIITQSPALYESHQTGQKLAQEILSSGDVIDRIFFYQDGAYVGLKNQIPGQGLLASYEGWVELKNNHSVPLHICIANGLRRGVVDNTESNRYEQLETLHPDFQLSGLGELVEAFQSSNRIITL